MSLPIEELIESIKRLVPGIPGPTLTAIETDLETKEAELKADRAGGAPKLKNQYVTVILDPEGKLKDAGEFVSLVIKLPENQDTAETLGRLYKSVYDQRAAAKRKVKVIETVADAAGAVKRKFLKENSITIVTKEPVRVLFSDNTIPAA